jgi:hypothetical protein
MMAWMSPHEMMTLFGSVSGGAATGYVDDHLVDGQLGRPAKTGSSTPPWVITGLTSMYVDTVVVHNHTVDAAKTIAISGGVSVNLTGPAIPPNGVRFNPFGYVASPQTTNTITVTISGNSIDIIIGEILAGRRRELGTYGVLAHHGIRYLHSAERPDSKLTALAGHDDGVEQRAIDCEVMCDLTGKTMIEDFWRATRGNTRPGVLIPFGSINDAWVGHMEDFQATDTAGAFKATFTFVEAPRGRW